MQSQKPNVRMIGAFVTASIALLVGLVIYFGSTRLFTEQSRFVMFFDQSVNGLNIGSLVKFRGVPVGAVEQILIRAEGQSEASSSIPVVIRVDASRLTKDLGLPDGILSGDNVEKSIERGLIARLNLESFVTGQLFIDFSIEPDKSEVRVRPLKEVEGMLVIPTVGSSLDEITSDVAKIISDVSAADIQQLVQNVNQLLVTTNTFIGGIDSEAISRSVTEAADKFTELLASKDFQETMTSARAALDQLTVTLESYQLDSGPMAESLQQLNQTLKGVDALAVNSQALIEPNSVFMSEMMATLREIARTAQSLRTLTDYLERNPDALLKGRAESKDN